MRRVIASVPWLLSRGLALVLVVLVFAEVGLRVAALFVHDRATDWQPEAQRRILCVGDSHTFGYMVPPDETYPAHLQRVLDDHAPRVYSVINLGIPGMNSAQVQKHLPEQVAKYHPDVVIVWCGANDTWNRAEVGDAPVLALGWRDRIANLSRVYRFFRVLRHDLQIERDFRSVEHAVGSAVGGRIAQRPDVALESPPEEFPNARFVVRHWDGSKEGVVNEGGEALPEPAAEEQARHDFGAMADYARTAGIKLVFITYPTELPAFAFANRAMRDVGQHYGLRVVESRASLSRIPEEKRIWLPAVHPSGPTYREIAQDVAAAILQDDRSAVPNP